MDAHGSRNEPMFDGGWTKDGEEGCLSIAIKVTAVGILSMVIVYLAWTALTALWT